MIVLNSLKLIKKINNINFFGLFVQEVGFLTLDSIKKKPNHFHSPDFQTYPTPLLFSVEMNIDCNVVLEFIIFFFFWEKLDAKIFVFCGCMKNIHFEVSCQNDMKSLRVFSHPRYWFEDEMFTLFTIKHWQFGFLYFDGFSISGSYWRMYQSRLQSSLA